jgi:hypothetical protein
MSLFWSFEEVAPCVFRGDSAYKFFQCPPETNSATLKMEVAVRFQTEDSDGVVTQKTAIWVTPAVTTLKGVFRLTLCPSFGLLVVCLSVCLSVWLAVYMVRLSLLPFIAGVVSHDADYRKIFFSRLFPTMCTGCPDRYRTSTRLLCAW